MLVGVRSSRERYRERRLNAGVCLLQIHHQKKFKVKKKSKKYKAQKLNTLNIGDSSALKIWGGMLGGGPRAIGDLIRVQRERERLPKLRGVKKSGRQSWGRNPMLGKMTQISSFVSAIRLGSQVLRSEGMDPDPFTYRSENKFWSRTRLLIRT